MTRDCKDIHQIIRAQDSWQDGWTRFQATGWAVAFVAVVIVVVGVVV